jgi:serine/threonine-protein kinase
LRKSGVENPKVSLQSLEAPPPEARIGEVIDERYEIVEHLGTGGMANVYRAEQLRTRALVAIKVLHPELSEHPEMSARFQREALASRKIQHPNVVAALDFGKLPDGCLFMVLEYIRGQDLSAVIYNERPFEQARAVKIALQVAHALVAAHAAGIVHRDLKPDNIMLIERPGDRDFVKVLDFGIAKLTQARGQALTALGSVFGTPEYMAPEQARGAQVDHRTDLYTLGIVLYEMLAGRTPFESEQLAQVIMGQISKPPPPLPDFVDQELAPLVIQLLAKDPNQRVQTSKELADRLARVLARLAPNHPVLRATGAIAAAGLPGAAVPPTGVMGAVPPSHPMPQPPPSSAGFAPAPAAPAAFPRGAPFAPPAHQPAFAPPSAQAPTSMAHPVHPQALVQAPAADKPRAWLGFLVLLVVLLAIVFIMAQLVLALL